MYRAKRQGSCNGLRYDRGTLFKKSDFGKHPIDKDIFEFVEDFDEEKNASESVEAAKQSINDAKSALKKAEQKQKSLKPQGRPKKNA